MLRKIPLVILTGKMSIELSEEEAEEQEAGEFHLINTTETNANLEGTPLDEAIHEAFDGFPIFLPMLSFRRPEEDTQWQCRSKNSECS